MHLEEAKYIAVPMSCYTGIKRVGNGYVSHGTSPSANQMGGENCAIPIVEILLLCTATLTDQESR